MSIEGLRKAKVTEFGVVCLGLPENTVVFFDKLGSENETYNKIYDSTGNLIFENVHILPKRQGGSDFSLQEI